MLKQKKQIFLKLKQQVIRTLNMREKNTQGQIELVFDSYSDNLEDVMDSNIDDKTLGKNNSLKLSKSSAPAFRPERAVPLLFGLFSNNIKATNSKDNNSSRFSLSNLSP